MEEKVIKFDIIKRLAELFPDMKMSELLDYIEYCKMIKAAPHLDVKGVTTE